MDRKIILTLIISLISVHGILAVVNFDKNLETNCKATIDSKTKAAIIDSINKLLMEQYVFPDVAKQMKDQLNTHL